MNSLRALSNQELELNLKNLVHQERKLLHVILEHIREVDRREFYLAKSYPSLYKYLVKEMGYSGSSATRRLEAARLLREVPVLAGKIQEGSVNLSQIGELSRMIKEKERTQQTKVSALEKNDLVAKISSQTLPESQRILSKELDLPLKTQEIQKVQKDASVRIELTLSKEQYELLSQSRDQASHILKQNHQDTSWASVIEVLAQQFLRKSARQESASATECGTKTVTERKTLTAKIRREVLKRDQCCQFKDPETGKQCQSTFALQVDHRHSQWAGGSHGQENLQILCAAHNAYKYRQESGVKKI